MLMADLFTIEIVGDPTPEDTSIDVYTPCPTCQGDGTVDDGEDCPDCYGTGRIEDNLPF